MTENDEKIRWKRMRKEKNEAETGISRNYDTRARPMEPDCRSLIVASLPLGLDEEADEASFFLLYLCLSLHDERWETGKGRDHEKHHEKDPWESEGETKWGRSERSGVWKI